MTRANSSLVTTVPSATTPDVVQMVGYGPTSQRPPNPPLGFIFTDTTVGFTVVWHGTVLQWLPMGSQGVQGAQGPQGVPGTPGVGVNVYYESPELVQMVSTSSVSASWETINFTTQLAAFGLASAKSALLQLETGYASSGGSNLRTATLQASGNNSVSISSGNTAKVIESEAREGGSGTHTAVIQVTVPFQEGSTSLYYNFQTSGSPDTPFARVQLVGFIT